MRFDAINPASMLPPQTGDGGAPLMGTMLFDPAMVAALANLPEDGNRPEDKHSKNEQEKTQKKNEENQDELPQMFHLIMGKDFSELLRFYFFQYDGATWFIQKKWRELLGVGEFDPLPFAMKKSPQVHERRLSRYEYAILFHMYLPGKRFSGSM